MESRKHVLIHTHMHFILRVSLFCLLLCYGSPAVLASDPLEVRALMKSGAITLALQQLDQSQPPFEKDPQAWVDWERQRVEIYRDAHEWKQLIQRLQKRPEGLDEEFNRWALQQMAEAYLATNDSNGAIRILRELIWQHARQVTGQDAGQVLDIALSSWRRLLIQAYLQADLVQDAEIAMLRFQQDYMPEDLDWKLLRARVLLRTDHADEAQALLAKERSSRAFALYYLAQLRGVKTKPEVIYVRAAGLAVKKKVPDDVQGQLWAVAAQAAILSSNYPDAIHAFSQALIRESTVEHQDPQEASLYSLSGNSLWKVYQDYGRMLGNKQQLLVGNDQEWFIAASNSVGKKPLQARAMFAALAEDTHSERTRRLAHEQFANLIMKNKHGLALIRSLYLEDKKLSLLAYLPETLRNRLVDDALARSDVALASRIISMESEAPEGVDALFWKMRRARILIMAGQIDEGIQALKALIKDTPGFPREQMDRLMQVLFDLQTVGRHEAAVELFKSLPMQGQDTQMHREVLYWIADSLQAQKKYQEAALYYLRSASYLNPDAEDPWAQTARYHAADAMVEAGLFQDATHIYQKLLLVTRDPSRRTVLKNKLQQLILQSNQKGKQVSVSEQNE